MKIVSHTRGLRFKSGFRHHNIRDRKGQNNFHKSLTSMFDESSNVEFLLIILVSDRKYLRLKSGFRNHYYSSVIVTN